jgi:hypothetical protein
VRFKGRVPRDFLLQVPVLFMDHLPQKPLIFLAVKFQNFARILATQRASPVSSDTDGKRKNVMIKKFFHIFWEAVLTD